MTPQEQELLQYLEDLQANNPAEYELLVKDLNEKAAAEGKGPAAAQNQGEQVTPTPGFVAKTRSFTNKGRKVFINICHSEHVDKPAPVEADPDSEEVQMRIPLSLGPPREDLDKTGEVCTVYDVVFNPEAVDMALKEQEMREFMMQLTVYQINQKCKDEVAAKQPPPPSTLLAARWSPPGVRRFACTRTHARAHTPCRSAPLGPLLTRCSCRIASSLHIAGLAGHDLSQGQGQLQGHRSNAADDAQKGRGASASARLGGGEEAQRGEGGGGGKGHGGG